ncbi:porin family protein [Adhaeribacter aquaticus]|uniref:porin family protein n=1 Tax=Adhaeribacter aquaticus TaxID=299567 RepID=UPI0004128D6F|nr:porin family protein [Adhaeribacter aquaticus]
MTKNKNQLSYLKKFSAALAFLLLIWTGATAQSVKLGIKGGANYGTITGKIPAYQDYDLKRKLSFNAGIFTNIAFSQVVAVQPEVLYSSKGFRIDDKRSAGSTTTEREITGTVNYLDVPVLAQVSAGNIYFEAGPQFSFLLNQETKDHQRITQEGLLGKSTTEGTTYNKSTDNYKPTDYGYAVGIGFKSADSPASINFRYTAGLSSFLKSDDVDARHSVFQVSLNFLLPYKN